MIDPLDYNLKDLVLIRLQSHIESVFKFNKTGVHRIAGFGSSNSYGKSAVFKGLHVLLTGEGLDSASREALIHDDYNESIISATNWANMQLTLLLHREAKKCFYELKVNGESYRKYINDDYQVLLQAMNFHYDKHHKFSLNRYLPKTTLPFTHTTPSFNYQVLDAASEIPEVRKALELHNSNLKIIDNDLDRTNRKIIASTELLNTLEVDSIDRMEARLTFLESNYKLYADLEGIATVANSIVEAHERLVEIEVVDYSPAEIILSQLHTLNQILTLTDKSIQTEMQLRDMHNNLGENPTFIESDVNGLRTLGKLLTAIDSTTRTMHELAEIKVEPINDLTVQLQNAQALIDIMKGIDTSIKLTNDLSEVNSSLVTIDTSIMNTTKATLADLSAALKLVDSLAGNHASISFIEISIRSLDQELRKLTSEIGICTACGGKLKEDRHLEVCDAHGSIAQ